MIYIYKLLRSTRAGGNLRAFFMLKIMNNKLVKNKKHYIYILEDPFDFKIRYIGITSNPNRRKRNYRTDSFNSNIHLTTWIDLVRSKGLNPVFKIIHECKNYDAAAKLESKLIKIYSSSLCNIRHKLKDND